MREPILVAAHPAGSQRLRKALAGHELMFVETLEQARSALEGAKFCCVILGIQFDDSNNLWLLDYLRSQKRDDATPVICVIGIRGRLSPAALAAFDQAARALHATEVLDLEQYPDDEPGNARLRQIVEGHFTR